MGQHSQNIIRSWSEIFQYLIKHIYLCTRVREKIAMTDCLHFNFKVSSYLISDKLGGKSFLRLYPNKLTLN